MMMVVHLMSWMTQMTRHEREPEGCRRREDRKRLAVECRPPKVQLGPWTSPKLQVIPRRCRSSDSQRTRAENGERSRERTFWRLMQWSRELL